MPGRLLMIRPVGWPRISTYGCSTARISRSVAASGSCPSAECGEATTISRSARGVVVGGDLSLRVDVGLDPVEHLDVGVGRLAGSALAGSALAGPDRSVDRVNRVGDRIRLRRDLGLVEPRVAEDPRAGGVVGDRVRVVPALRGRLDHLRDREPAVRPVGVGVEVAAQVFGLDEVGKLARRGRRDLAVVLPEFGRHGIHVERLVDAVLGLARDALADPLARVGVVDVGDVEEAGRTR